MKPGQFVRHPDYLPPGVVERLDGTDALVRFKSAEGWPFPKLIRIPVSRLRRYTPPEPDYEPAPF